MMKNPIIRIGILGAGTVANGTANALIHNQQRIRERLGAELKITAVGARTPKNYQHKNADSVILEDLMQVATHDNVDIVCELIGGIEPARSLILAAIKAGKHVVTANKALIAEHGSEIFAAARAYNVDVSFEAAVAGGIPIIKALREGLAGNQIEWLAGIINGTGNFIMSEMRDKGRDFADVLQEAQALGYAEADPSFDINGTDAAHKITILAALAFGIELQFNACYIEGITAITALDVAYAEELGYRIKHLGMARQTPEGIQLRVHPALIPKRRLLANVDGVMNAVVVKSDLAGATLYYGAGAGAGPTGSAVVADIIDRARCILHQAPRALAVQDLSDAPNPTIMPISDITSAYYLRIGVKDQTGVMTKITGILAKAGISIEAVIQKEPAHSSIGEVDLVLITSKIVEHKLDGALVKIANLDAVVEKISRIRIVHLD